MRNFPSGMKAISLLVLGPVLAWGSWGFDLKGGLWNCLFPLPFVLCNVCPVPCAFRGWRGWIFSGVVGGNLLLGRLFCGLWCPLGAAHDLLFKLPLRKLRLPQEVEPSLKSLKYVIAFFAGLLIIEVTLWQGIPIIEGLWLFLSIYLSSFHLLLISLIGLSLFLSPFLPRVWCRYLCPVGVWTSPFNRYSLAELKLESGRCNACLDCAEKCPAGLSFPAKEWESWECFRCLECYAACKRKAIGFKLKGGWVK